MGKWLSRPSSAEISNRKPQEFGPDDHDEPTEKDPLTSRRHEHSEKAALSEFKESFAATAAAANLDFSSRQGEAQTHRADIDSDSIKSTILPEEILPSIDFIKHEELEVTSPKDTDETYVKSISSRKSVNLDKSEFSIPETVSLGISEIAEEHKDDYVDVHRQPLEGDISTSPKHVSQERIPVQETSKAPYDRSSPTFGVSGGAQLTFVPSHGRASAKGLLTDNTRDKGINSSESCDPTDYILTTLTEDEVERLETKAFKLGDDLNALNDWNFIQACAAKREATQQEEEQISAQHVYVIVYVRTKMEKYCTRIRDVWQNSGFEKEFPHAKLMLLEYFSPSGIHVTADPEYSPRRQKSAVWMKKMHPLVQNFYKDIRDKHSNITYITADTLVYKERENRLEETDCIVIYVPYKGIVPIKEHFFPKTYKGLPVDIRRGVFEFLVNERFEKRLKTGCSVSKFDEKNNHLGTIGMFVKCRQTNEVGLITAYHVVTGDKEVSAPSDVREPPEKKEILKLGLRERQSSDIGSSIASSNAGDARGNEKTTLIHQASCIDRANAQSESRLCAYVFDKIFYGNHPTHKLNFLKNIQVPVTLQGPVVPTGQGLETFSDDQLVSVVPDVGVDALFAPVFTIRAPTADFKDAANELPGYRLHQQLSFRNARVLPLEKLFGRPGAIESEDVMVYKNGCTTNLTQGKIRFFGSVAFPHDQNLLVRTPRLCGYLGNMTSVALNNLLEVERVTTGAGPSRVFADGGDSGSIVFSVNFPRDDRVGSMRDNSVGSVGDDHIDIVGMLVGRLTNTEIYVVTPIEAVFDALDVELLNDDDYNEIEVLWRYRNIKTKA